MACLRVRQRKAPPKNPNPSSIVSHVPGSGTAVLTLTLSSLKPSSLRSGLEKLAPINQVLPLTPCGLMLRVLLPLLPAAPEENVLNQGMGQVWPSSEAIWLRGTTP